MKPLFTCIVLCYRNFMYIYETINSVLKQDYENIELIVCDDGSRNFPEDTIKDYIMDLKGSNISNVIIHHSETNQGTVRNMNCAFSLANGKYIHSLSADDEYESSNIVSLLVQEMDDTQAQIMMSQTAMCGSSTKDIHYYFTQGEIIRILENENTAGYELYHKLIFLSYLPSPSTIFSKKYFEQFGLFDESFFLVEDWPLHLRLARNHIPIQYLDVVAVRHRTGGISHGNAIGKTETYYKYIKDLLVCYEREVKPYKNIIPQQDYKALSRKHRKEICWYEWSTAKSFWNRIWTMLKYPEIYIDIALQRLYPLLNGFCKRTIVSCLGIIVLYPMIIKYISQLTRMVGIGTLNLVWVQNLAFYILLIAGLFHLGCGISWLYQETRKN